MHLVLDGATAELAYEEIGRCGPVTREKVLCRVLTRCATTAKYAEPRRVVGQLLTRCAQDPQLLPTALAAVRTAVADMVDNDIEVDAPKLWYHWCDILRGVAPTARHSELFRTAVELPLKRMHEKDVGPDEEAGGRYREAMKELMVRNVAHP